MTLNEKEISSLINELYLDKDINLIDIPNLSLYMDQVITLFEDNLSHLKRNGNEKLMTKTMINNYTKSKVLLPPTKKKYSKDHIILLILIYNLKQTLSINDIKSLFSEMPENPHSLKDIELEKIYQSFSNIKKLQANELHDELSKKIKLIQNNKENFNSQNLDLSQMLITVLSLVNEANIKRRLAEKIIDKFFDKDN